MVTIRNHPSRPIRRLDRQGTDWRAEKLGKPVEAQAIVAIDWKYRPGMTFGPMAVENRSLLQKDFSIANQVHAPGENLDALPAKAASRRNEPCPADSGSSASQRYDGLAIGSSIGMQDCARRR